MGNVLIIDDAVHTREELVDILTADGGSDVSLISMTSLVEGAPGDVDDLVRMADEALCRGKVHDRNRVEKSSGLVE